MSKTLDKSVTINYSVHMVGYFKLTLVALILSATFTESNKAKNKQPNKAMTSKPSKLQSEYLEHLYLCNLDLKIHSTFAKLKSQLT